MSKQLVRLGSGSVVVGYVVPEKNTVYYKVNKGHEIIWFKDKWETPSGTTLIENLKRATSEEVALLRLRGLLDI